VHKVPYSWVDVLTLYVILFLTAQQKQKLHQITSDDTIFLPSVTGDKSWIHGNDPETKQQSSQCKMKNKFKKMFIFFGINRIVHTGFIPQWKMKNKFKKMFIFFDINRIVHTGFILAGPTTNSTYYCEVLQ
jgi:hypothetical protein